MFIFNRLSWKLVFIFVLIVLIGTSAISYYAVYNMQDKVISASHEKLHSDLTVAKAFLDKQIPGSWEVKDGKLLKGNTVINNIPIVDEIKEMTGDNVTIFLEDTRIATTVRNPDGNRGTGTKAVEGVSNTVLKDKKPFVGKAQVVGIENQTIYEPIVDPSGKTIGMFFVGVPNAPYDIMIADFIRSLVVSVILEALIAAVIIYYVSRKLARPIEKLAAAAEGVSMGNLTVKIDVSSKDEVGVLANSMRGMVSNLDSLVRQVVLTSEQLKTASEALTASSEQAAQATSQVAGTITEVAQGANQQSQEVNSSASAIEQMSASINQIATTTASVTTMADKTTESTQNGSQAVNAAITQMGIIESTVKSSATVVSKLGERSQQIGQIIDTISGIAGQTNLLALNAAIEAARAGEQGRGFAVVAEEVRKLAEQSEEAAKHISSLISEIQQETDNAVDSMAVGTQEVKKGAEVVAIAGNSFNEIASMINMVSEQVKEIAAAIQQMAAGSQHIVVSIRDIETVSKTVAKQTQTASAAIEEESSSMEEIAASSEALSILAEELQKEVKKFII